MTVPPLTLRLEKGSPLSFEEGDNNLRILANFCNSLAALMGVSLNPDGTIKPSAVPAGLITTGMLSERLVEQSRLGWLHPFYAVTTGTANAYAVTLLPSEGFTYGDGLTVDATVPQTHGVLVLLVKIHATNTGASTINVNGAGAKSIVTTLGAPLGPGALQEGGIYVLVYDGARFQVIGTVGGNGELIFRTSCSASQYPQGVPVCANSFVVEDIDFPDEQFCHTYYYEHGLGGTPAYMRIVAVCKQADLGFLPGDELDSSNIKTRSSHDDNEWSAPYLILWANPTHVGFTTQKNTGNPGLHFTHKSKGDWCEQNLVPVVSRWSLKIVAFR